MMDLHKITPTQLRNPNTRTEVKRLFLNKFSNEINLPVYKKILVGMSSGCGGCRAIAFSNALKELKI